MSADKRSVSTDALDTLGMVHFREEKRDAIHLAVMPVEAGETLMPGQHIGVVNGKAFMEHQPIGIVDPFLLRPVEAGERFWLVIYPRKIQSLRHVWSHPALPDEGAAPGPDDGELAAARRAIHAVAVDLGVSDEALMEGASEWLKSKGSREGYMHFGDDLSYAWDMPAFWSAYALLTGKDVPEDLRQAFFSCAC